MKHDDHDPEPPRDLLGESLWAALGAAEAPEAPASLDAAVRARIDEDEGREALGDELWELLGHASPVVVPERARPRRQPLPWPGLVMALVAASIAFVAVPLLRPAPPERGVDDLALLRELELTENLELVRNPDFDLLLRWDGAAPGEGR